MFCESLAESQVKYYYESEFRTVSHHSEKNILVQVEEVFQEDDLGASVPQLELFRSVSSKMMWA